MEVYGFSSDVVALGRMMVYSVVEAVVVGTLSAAQRSLAGFLMMTGSLPKDIDVLPKLPGIDKRFPIDELHRRKHPGPENKDASDTEDDDEEEDDAQGEDDEGDEDFSGEEGGDDDDDDEEGDPEENPEANGNGGSDDEDDDDEDGDEDDEGDEDEDEEDEDEDEDDQPPAKKRK